MSKYTNEKIEDLARIEQVIFLCNLAVFKIKKSFNKNNSCFRVSPPRKPLKANHTSCPALMKSLQSSAPQEGREHLVPPSHLLMLQTISKTLHKNPVRRNYDKLRVVLLYTNFKGSLSREERQVFIDRLGFSDADKEALDGLQVLGFRPEVGILLFAVVVISIAIGRVW